MSEEGFKEINMKKNRVTAYNMLDGLTRLEGVVIVVDTTLNKSSRIFKSLSDSGRMIIAPNRKSTPIISKKYKSLDMGKLTIDEINMYMLWVAVMVIKSNHPCLYVTEDTKLRQFVCSKILLFDMIHGEILSTKANDDDFNSKVDELERNKRFITNLEPNRGISGWKLFRGKNKLTMRRDEMTEENYQADNELEIFDKIVLLLNDEQKKLTTLKKEVSRMLDHMVTEQAIQRILDKSCFTKSLLGYWSVDENKIGDCRIEIMKMKSYFTAENSDELGYNMVKSAIIGIFYYENAWMTVDELSNIIDSLDMRITSTVIENVLRTGLFERREDKFRVKESERYMLNKNTDIHKGLLKLGKIKMIGGKWQFVDTRSNKNKWMAELRSISSTGFNDVNEMLYKLNNRGFKLDYDDFLSELRNNRDIRLSNERPWRYIFI